MHINRTGQTMWEKRKKERKKERRKEGRKEGKKKKKKVPYKIYANIIFKKGNKFQEYPKRH